MAAQLESVKWIPGTKFLVDGFRFQSTECQAYFLTHAHSDHTTGLSRSWSAGTIYCSPVTSRLIREELGVHQRFVEDVPLNSAVMIKGVKVTFLDANHCPGACMILFKVVSDAGETQHVLHTGDFRFQPFMAAYPALQKLRVNTLLLDTTYAAPKWSFPSQDEAIGCMAEIMLAERSRCRDCVFVTNSYHIGKERCYFGAALKCGLRVWASPKKLQTLKRLDLHKEWLALLVCDVAKADLIISDNGVNPAALSSFLESLRRPVVGFQCTGWSYQKSGIRKREQGGFTIYGIPYSEHSSWTDLRDCVSMLRPSKLIPTVNVKDAASLAAMRNRFSDLMDLSSSRGHMDMYLIKGKRKRPQLAAEASPAAPDTPDRTGTTSTRDDTGDARAIFDVQVKPDEDVELGIEKVRERVWGPETCSVMAPAAGADGVYASGIMCASGVQSCMSTQSWHDAAGNARQAVELDVCDVHDLTDESEADDPDTPAHCISTSSSYALYESCGWRRRAG